MPQAEDGIRWDIDQKFFPVRAVKHWNRFPRTVLAAPSLEVSMTGLDEAWSSLV